MMTASKEIFKIEGVEHRDNIVKAILSINADSPIFRGHFPGQPVVPGACMLQLVKDLLSGTVGYAVQLRKGNNLKFVGMVVPSPDNALTLELSHKVTDEAINVNAKLSDGDRVCFKFQGTFQNRD
jgi:3-hydroxyacyl-[acyl-carrier-protein] dehydratase